MLYSQTWSSETATRTWRLNPLQLVIPRAVPSECHKTTINYCSWCNTDERVLAGKLPPTCVLVGTGGMWGEALGRVCIGRHNSNACHPAGAVLQLHHDGSDRQTVGTGQWEWYRDKYRSGICLKGTILSNSLYCTFLLLIAYGWLGVTACHVLMLKLLYHLLL